MKTFPKVLYDRIEARYRGRPVSRSRKLWQLRRAARIASHNPSVETILEESVAMLAKNRHMPGYFNQCPVAAFTYTRSRAYGRRAGNRSATQSGRRTGKRSRTSQGVIEGDEVGFVSRSYSKLLDGWMRRGNSRIRAHARAVRSRYGRDARFFDSPPPVRASRD